MAFVATFVEVEAGLGFFGGERLDAAFVGVAAFLPAVAAQGQCGATCPLCLRLRRCLLLRRLLLLRRRRRRSLGLRIRRSRPARCLRRSLHLL